MALPWSGRYRQPVVWRLYEYEHKNFEQAKEGLAKAIYNYNWMRPHQALAMKNSDADATGKAYKSFVGREIKKVITLGCQLKQEYIYITVNFSRNNNKYL